MSIHNADPKLGHMAPNSFPLSTFIKLIFWLVTWFSKPITERDGGCGRAWGSGHQVTFSVICSTKVKNSLRRERNCVLSHSLVSLEPGSLNSWRAKPCDQRKKLCVMWLNYKHWIYPISVIFLNNLEWAHMANILILQCFIRFHIDALSEHGWDKAIRYKLSSESLSCVFAYYQIYEHDGLYLCTNSCAVRKPMSVGESWAYTVLRS